LGGRGPAKPFRGPGCGETRFPHTPLRGAMFTSAVHAAAPHTEGMKKGSSWEGCALPNPPAGGAMGKPGVPIPLRGGGVGKPGFPTPLFESLCSR